MSLDRIKTVFRNLDTTTDWSLQLLRITNSKRNGTKYASRQIIFSPAGKLAEFVGEIAGKYTSDTKSLLDKYSCVEEYNGSALDTTIYKLQSDNALISTEYAALMAAIADPETEADPLDFTAHAYIIRGQIQLNGVDTRVKLISMQNPVTMLKHKFWKDSGTFKEFTDKVLSLKPTVEVVIINDDVYFLTMAGERLFNMERAYRTICSEKVETVTQADILSDPEAFKQIAETGHNPRRFVAFSESRLKALKNKSRRLAMSKKFSIAIKDDKFDMDVEGTADKVVKLLCNKGMVDPFENTAVEVPSAKLWL